MTATIAMLAILMASQVSAYPSLWNDRHQGCALPMTGFKGHLAPINDTALTFALTDSKGAAVTSYTPKGSYTLKVSYTSVAHFWVATSAGAFSTTTDVVGCNNMSAYRPKAPTDPFFSVTWTAPETCINVSVFTNAATGPTDSFRQAKMTIPCSPATPSTPTPSPPTGGAASIALSAVAVVVALMALLM